MLIMATAVDDLLTTIRSAGGAQRERALRAGAETLPESAMIELLREEADDVARNTGLEMLKLRGRRSFVAAAALLDDADDDVVLQAVLLLDSIGDPRAWPLLRPLLQRSNENIQQAVIAARFSTIRSSAILPRSRWRASAARPRRARLRSGGPPRRARSMPRSGCRCSRRRSPKTKRRCPLPHCARRCCAISTRPTASSPQRPRSRCCLSAQATTTEGHSKSCSPA